MHVSAHGCIANFYLREQTHEKGFRKINTDILDECALICMGTFQALQNRSADAHRLAVLCVGICEECAEICESLPGDEYSRCAAACRRCSDSMSDMAFASLN